MSLISSIAMSSKVSLIFVTLFFNVIHCQDLCSIIKGNDSFVRLSIIREWTAINDFQYFG